MFMAQVAHCYKGELSTFAQEIIDVLQNHNTVLDPNIRMASTHFLLHVFCLRESSDNNSE